MEGGRVSRSFGIGVVSHGYGWLCGGRDRGGGWHACVTKPEVVGCMSVDTGELREFEVNTLMTPDHTALQVNTLLTPDHID